MSLAADAPMRNEGPFTPPSLEGTVVLPSNVGGAHWGGVAVDPARQIAVVPVNHLVAMVQLIPLDRYDTTGGAPERVATRRPVHAHARHAIRDAAAHR